MAWFEINSSEILFWGGALLMAVSAVSVVIWLVVFGITGRKLKKKLEEEYGKPER